MIRGLRPQQSGFTVLETIIVLTVSMGILSGMFVLFQQRIPKTQFNNAVGQMQTDIIDMYSQIVSGYYPGAEQITCNDGVVSQSVGAGSLGQNEGCLYLGQAIHFGSNSACSASSKDKCTENTIYTIFGKSQKSGSPATNINDTEPKIDQLASRVSNNAYSAYVTDVKNASTSPNQSISGFAFVQEFSAGTNNANQGNKQISLLPLAPNYPSVSTNFKNNFNTAALSNGFSIKGVYICMDAGTGNQYAKIIVGGNKSLSDVSRVLYGDKTSWQADGCS